MSCAFFDNLPENPSHEQIHNALIDAICNTMEITLRHFKTDMKLIASHLNDYPSDEALNEAMQKVYTSHTKTTMFSLETMFYGRPDILRRVDRAVKKPRLIGADKKLIKSGFYHVGLCYGFYWFGITGLKPSSLTISELNHIHADSISKILEDLFETFENV